MLNKIRSREDCAIVGVQGDDITVVDGDLPGNVESKEKDVTTNALGEGPIVTGSPSWDDLPLSDDAEFTVDPGMVGSFDMAGVS